MICVSTFFFSSRRRHTRLQGDWSSDVCSSDLHAHSKHLHVQSRLVGYVGEGAVMIVVIELRRRVLLKVAGPVHAIHEKNVRPAVVVVVNEGHTWSHGFGEKFLSESAIVVDETEPGLLRDIAEL